MARVVKVLLILILVIGALLSDIVDAKKNKVKRKKPPKMKVPIGGGQVLKCKGRKCKIKTPKASKKPKAPKRPKIDTDEVGDTIEEAGGDVEEAEPEAEPEAEASADEESSPQ